MRELGLEIRVQARHDRGVGFRSKLVSRQLEGRARQDQGLLHSAQLRRCEG